MKQPRSEEARRPVSPAARVEERAMKRVEPPYVSLPDGILRLTTLTASAKLVWAYLRRVERAGWTRLPRTSCIAEACAISLHCVSSALKALRVHKPPLLGTKPGSWPGASQVRLFWTFDPRSPKEMQMSENDTGLQQDLPERVSKAHPEVRQKCTQHITQEDNNEDTHTTATDCARAESAPELTKEEKDEPTKEETHIVGTVFPHGCTEPQRQRLLQAVVQGRRMGAPYWFIRAAALWHPEMAPWKSIERELALAAEDAMQAAGKFDLPLFTISAYRKFLTRNVKDPAVRSWVRSEQPRCKRANAMLSEPGVWNEKSRTPGQRPATSTPPDNPDAGAAPRPTLNGGVE